MLRQTIIACVVLLSLLLPGSSWAASAFCFADVQAKAQDLAHNGWTDAPAAPEFLVKLNYAEWSGIRYRKEKAVWADEGLPFNLEFFHQGLYYDRPVKMHIVDDSGVSDIAFDPSLFQYGSEKLAHLVFSGFVVDLRVA